MISLSFNNPVYHPITNNIEIQFDVPIAIHRNACAVVAHASSFRPPDRAALAASCPAATATNRKTHTTRPKRSARQAMVVLMARNLIQQKQIAHSAMRRALSDGGGEAMTQAMTDPVKPRSAFTFAIHVFPAHIGICFPLRYPSYRPFFSSTNITSKTSILRPPPTATSLSPSSSISVPKVRMAQPSSSHHEERRHRSERERERERSHHHHRTISSTTLLIVLSLMLAVLAVMLSLPSAQSAVGSDGTGSTGVLGYLNPKRTQALIQRERDVAVREAEVARREAELLAGAPGGVVPTPAVCPPCAATTTVETVAGPVQTIIKEVVKEDSLTPPGWVGTRAEELLDRELKIAERERDISKREEAVNRREHDASRRETWIMEQLHALGNDNPQHVEDEYIYEPVGSSKRKAKYRELPPLVVSETAYETETKTVIQTQTVTVPPPANTRLAANPKPEGVTSPSTPSSPRTTAVEIVTEEDDDDVDEPRATRTLVRGPRATRRPPSRWFGGW
ncbi:hypothetical protein LshimejAT787_0205110 [Lyophyllum shimeji]|uniref:Uncharacterized protein n=1 Tax=Lyophyllum shimeji TaxID=47721 RepID=A0A9P3UL21_LYOSH|nr:hypothetical protein LshimejAT787_0205110 [Lyophyllum shimeji]